jgi:hypothetical protein
MALSGHGILMAKCPLLVGTCCKTRWFLRVGLGCDLWPNSLFRSPMAGAAVRHIRTGL